MRYIGCCVLEGKEYVTFEDKHCRPGEFKMTDGFRDKLMKWNSERLVGASFVTREDVNFERIVKRLRGARPWHPLLKELRKEAAV